MLPDDAPADKLYVPIGQSIQVKLDDAPTCVEYLPAMQEVQTLEPSALYVPATHEKQRDDIAKPMA